MSSAKIYGAYQVDFFSSTLLRLSYSFEYFSLAGTTPESVVFNKSKGLILSMYNTLIDNAGLDPSLMPPPEDYSMTKSKALQGKS